MTAARQFEHSIEEIKAALAASPVELARALGLAGRISQGNYWVRDFRRGDGGNLSSFAIHMSRGIWKNWAADEGGDLLHLIAVFACGGDDKRAVKWALDWLGWSGTRPDPAKAAALVERAREADAKAHAEAQARRRAARALWLSAKPLTGDDPVSLYLRGRGVNVMRFKDGPPNALRFVPDCKVYPEGGDMPAMVACIAVEGVGIMAAHRTYLTQAGGQWVKAFAGQERDGKPVPAKRVLGAYAGGSIRLTRGSSGKALVDAPAGEWVAIGEGIENVLSAAQVRQDLRCLASVSVSNLGNVKLPPQIGGVYVLADNDKEPAAIAALDRAMDALALAGHEPVCVRVDGNFKDMNDAYRGAL